MCGMTALLDAVGRSVLHMEHEQEVNPEKASKVIEEKEVLVTVENNK